MKVLIPTQSHDVHAKAVASALATKGHEAVLWYASDLPTQQTLSLSYKGSSEAQLELQGVDINHHGAFDVVWLRRPASPVLPSTMHPGDHTFAVQEWRSVLEGVWDTLSRTGFWINPRSAARRAESKPAQLAAARRVGLDVPPMLQRVFAVDVLTCPRCMGPMSLKKVANTPDDIARVLAKVGLGPRTPPRPRAAPPGQLELEFAA
ncbi:hypothetical protein ENSA5_18510 [Enhygromyxa salina]|uniref:MvdD-like pre-ATP grasp domain-containing protein n=1 Tax=Enhygromyxa salina TaxID=215803 RepID=A0A2S9YCU5_9BACT|nr:hypothetical protein [Enhygromyxa salina]PRQ02913.1 hypothetical protein ENSA5_18510 [Enhygromyxa salina]